MQQTDRKNFDYHAFHQEIETLRRKYGIAIGYYFIDDIVDYLNDYVFDEGAPSHINVRAMAEWMWDNTSLRKNIHNHINNPDFLTDIIGSAHYEYEKAHPDATTHE